MKELASVQMLDTRAELERSTIYILAVVFNGHFTLHFHFHSLDTAAEFDRPIISL